MNPIAPPAAAPRVALYARYSSDRQSEHSIDDQLRICRAYAERQGWTVVRSFQDAAISGTTTQRPGYQALIDAMRQGELDVVLAEALDRFSRDQEHIAAFHKLVGLFHQADEEGRVGVTAALVLAAVALLLIALRAWFR